MKTVISNTPVLLSLTPFPQVTCYRPSLRDCSLFYTMSVGLINVVTVVIVIVFWGLVEGSWG